MIKYSFTRIVNDRVKLGIILFFYASMIINFHMSERLDFCLIGGKPISPDYITFLAGGTGSFFFHMLLLWFMPIVLMLLFCDDCIEDYITGNKNILITKFGRKRYYTANVFKGFMLSFLFFLTMLLINWSYAKIIANGATDNQFVSMLPYMKSNGWFMYSYNHPDFINGMYIIGTSVLAGIVGGSCSAIALVIHNRKLAYPISFIPWFIAFKMRNSITMSIQPFTEYSAKQGAPAYIGVVAAYILIAVGLLVWEKKHETIS